MLDKGHLQYMGLGVCTISPKINTQFPYFQKMTPGKNYIQCADDYSNLIEKVNWCLDNPEECRRIGGEASFLFHHFCLPKNVARWVSEVMNGEHKK
jgi:hypothetical protein